MVVLFPCAPTTTGGGGGGGGAVCHELPACEEARLRRPIFWNYGTEKVYELQCKGVVSPPPLVFVARWVLRRKTEKWFKVGILVIEPPNQSSSERTAARR